MHLAPKVDRHRVGQIAGAWLQQDPPKAHVVAATARGQARPARGVVQAHLDLSHIGRAGGGRHLQDVPVGPSVARLQPGSGKQTQAGEGVPLRHQQVMLAQQVHEDCVVPVGGGQRLPVEGYPHLPARLYPPRPPRWFDRLTNRGGEFRHQVVSQEPHHPAEVGLQPVGNGSDLGVRQRLGQRVGWRDPGEGGQRRWQENTDNRTATDQHRNRFQP